MFWRRPGYFRGPLILTKSLRWPSPSASRRILAHEGKGIPGARFATLGVALSALIVAGYFWSGEWFAVWLAVVNGGGYILCGLWMRRA